jgi:hypothetical protein
VRAQHDGAHATQAVVHFVRQQAQVLLANGHELDGKGELVVVRARVLVVGHQLHQARRAQQPTRLK